MRKPKSANAGKISESIKMEKFRAKKRGHKFDQYCACPECNDRLREIEATRIAAESY